MGNPRKSSDSKREDFNSLCIGKIKASYLAHEACMMWSGSARLQKNEWLNKALLTQLEGIRATAEEENVSIAPMRNTNHENAEI